MRFKASIRNISTFTRLTASLSSLGKDVWLQLNNEQLRFTVVPEQGSQVWAVLAIDTIFESYTIQSAAENNTINLRVPLPAFHRALRSALSASSASIRLTKKDNIPLLSLTIITNNLAPAATAGRGPPATLTTTLANDPFPGAANADDDNETFDQPPTNNAQGHHYDRETTITQDIPIIVLAPATVASIHEPRAPQPDVHIKFPPLHQLKAIAERFTKLALSSTSTSSTSTSFRNGGAGARVSDAPISSSQLILSANAHGELKIGVETAALKIESRWKDLTNPELDPEANGGVEGVRVHASTRRREMELEGGEEWSTVRVEGRDLGRVLGVGRLGGTVIACFCHNHALILYVYLGDEDRESVLTYYIASYSA